MIKYLIACLICYVPFIGVAQDFSNKGKDFYITYPAHANDTRTVMGLYLTSDISATGTITVGTQTIPFTVTANKVTTKFLGPNSAGDAPNTSVYLSQDDGIAPNAAIHVVSDNPIVVYAHIIFKARSGATLVLPSNVWGREYIIPSHSNSGTSARSYGVITVVAKDSNTTIEIIPTINSKNGAKIAGNTYNITIPNPGDVYQLQMAEDQDMSGTVVRSISTGKGCKKIAVFSSTTWSAFGCSRSGSGDNLYQQLFPTGAWGKNFLTAPFAQRTADIIRVYVTDPATNVIVTENGSQRTLTTLTSNSYYEVTTGNPLFIQADKPVSVVQFITTQDCNPGSADIGDPEMVLINPLEQTINNITLFSAHQNWVPPSQSNITNCYLNIIIQQIAASSFTINGNQPTGSFINIPGTKYAYLQEDVTAISLNNPVQTLQADSSFTAIAYGLGNVESYGYNAGTNVSDLSQGLVLKNQYATTNIQAACRNAPFTLSTKLSYIPNTLSWDFNNNPNLTPNNNIGPISNPVPDSTFLYNGKTIYVFKLPNTFQYAQVGSFPVKIITDNPTTDGCSGLQENTFEVTVYEKPTTKWVKVHSGCLLDAVKFYDSSNTIGRPIIKWLWNFGDGTIDSIANPVKKYATAGTDSVRLSIITDIGCLSDTIIPISISTVPIAAFIVGSTSCVDTAVTFINQSTNQVGTISHWYWDYGNSKKDTLITGANPKQSYDTIGSFVVSLQVQTATGCLSSISSVPLSIHPFPIVNFQLPKICLSDGFATFTDSSNIIDGTQSAFSYLWHFGDPNASVPTNPDTSIAKNGQHHYSQTGNYPVSLRVTGKGNCASSVSKTFTVNGAFPTASFKLLDSVPLCSNKPVQLKNLSTVDFGTITKVELYWDYANQPTKKVVDDSPYQGKIYQYQYPSFQSPYAKPIQIRTVVYSGKSCSDDTIINSTLYQTPKAGFTKDKDNICVGKPVQFMDASTGTDSAKWHYSFGTLQSNSSSPTMLFYTAGNIPVNLFLTNSKGCVSDTIPTQYVLVNDLPTISFPTKIEYVLEGGNTTLKPDITGDSLSYIWRPSTYLSDSLIAHPMATPLKNITYTLVVTAKGNCVAKDTFHLQVLSTPLIPNAFSPNGDGKNDTWTIPYLSSYPECTVQVFNRYGQIVYNSIGYYRAWDGTYNYKPLPYGTYYYIIRFGGFRPQLNGSVTIIR